nr:hypothetical protein [Pantoea sp. BAV 3049]
MHELEGQNIRLRATEQVVDLTMAGLIREFVAGQLGIGKASVYRILKAWRLQHRGGILPGERVKSRSSNSETVTDRATKAP